MRRSYKRLLLIPLGLALFFIIFVIAALSRNFAIPAYVSLFYTHGVSKTFDNSFGSLNAQLHHYGVYMYDAKATCHNGISDGGDVDYHHLSATVPCQRSEASNAVMLSPATISQLRHTLLQSGWKSGTPPLPTSVAFTDSIQLGGMAYKFNGKTYCVFGYNAFAADTPHTVTEACERDVSFFGGDNG